MAESISPPSAKRPHPETESHAKRHVRRKLQHEQRRPQNVEPAPQDRERVAIQLERSITAALVSVGFNSVLPTALEMLRSHTEEFMLNFLADVRESCSTSRRTIATPQDFAFALAHSPNTSTAALLAPQLKLHLPEGISFPFIADPNPEETPPPDVSAVLGPLVDSDPPSYIPGHFPQLPPKHAWIHTDVFPERERDARRMREKAAEEGFLAEKALRKLAAAEKTGAVKDERRRLNTLSGHGERLQDGGRGTQRGKKRPRGSSAGEEMFGDMMKDIAVSIDADESQAMDLGLDGRQELQGKGVDVGMPEGVVVNADMGTWRSGASKRVAV